MAAKKMKCSVGNKIVFVGCGLLLIILGVLAALTWNGVPPWTETAEKRSLTLLSVDNQIFYIDYEEHDDSAENDRYIGRTFAFELGYRVGTETFAFSEEDAPLSAVEGEPLFTCTVKDRPFEDLTVAQDSVSRGTFTVRLKEDPAAQEGFQDFLDDPSAIGDYWECPVRMILSPAGYDPIEFYLTLVPRPSYTVTLELNGGSRKEDKPLYAWVGVPLDNPGDPTPPFKDPAVEEEPDAAKSPVDYMFDGWYLVDNAGNMATEKYDFSANYYFDSDITLRARYKSALTVCDFTETDGDGVKETSRIYMEGNAEYTVYYNEPLPGPLPGAAEMAKTTAANRGWTFGGWFTEEGGKGIENGVTAAKGGPVFTARPKLYAKWYCMGQFDPVFGAAIAEQEIVWRAPVDLPSPTYNNGGIFEGWYFEDSLRLPAPAEGVLFDLNTVTPEKGILPLTAWVKFPVILNWDDSDGDTARVENGGYVRYQGTMEDLGGSLPASGTKLKESGWNFADWYRNVGGKEGEFTVSTFYTEAKALTLYAKWTTEFTLRRSLDEDGKETALVLDKNGEILLNAQTQQRFEAVYHAGLVLPKPMTAAGKDNGGWTFGGWFTEDHGGGTEVTDLVGEETYLAEGARTLFARWTGTISFDYTLPDLVVGEPTLSLPLVYGALLPTLPEPVYDHDGSFVGWYDGQYGKGETRYLSGSPYSGAAAYTLHARVSFPLILEFQDSILNGDSTEGRTKSLLYGFTWRQSGVTLPAGPEKRGWNFADWHTALSGNRSDTLVFQSADSDPLFLGTEPRTIFAWWKTTLNVYKEITALGGLDTQYTPYTVYYNQPLDRMDNVPQATGWEFGGYYTERGGEGEQLIDESGNTSPDPFLLDNVTDLFAKWTTTVNFHYAFDGDGAEIAGKQEKGTVVYQGKIRELPQPRYEGGGVFLGWFPREYGVGTDEEELKTEKCYGSLEANIDVYDRIGFSVPVDLQDGTEPKLYSVNYGWTFFDTAASGIPSDPVKNGWDFEKWHEGTAKGSPEFNFNTAYLKRTAVTVYAWWTSTFTLKKELDDAGPTTAFVPLNVYYNQPIPHTEILAAGDWAFGGYYTRQGGLGEQFLNERGEPSNTGTYTGEGRRTLFAKWSTQAILNYTLAERASFSGQKVESVPLVYNAPFPELPSPQYLGGGVSVGWFTAPSGNGTEYKYDGRTVYTGGTGLMLYNRVDFTLTVDYQDAALNGDVLETHAVTYGKLLNDSLEKPLPDDLAKSGWDFDNWHDATVGGKIVTGNTTYDYETSITVYAWWKSDFTLKKELGDTGTATDAAATLTVYYNQPIRSTDALTAGEWAFGGYYTEKGGNGMQILNASGAPLSSEPYTEAPARTLYAKWSTTIRFAVGGGENIPAGTKLGTPSKASMGVVYNHKIGELPTVSYSYSEQEGEQKVKFEGWYPTYYGFQRGTGLSTDALSADALYTGAAVQTFYDRTSIQIVFFDPLNNVSSSGKIYFGLSATDSGFNIPTFNRPTPTGKSGWRFSGWRATFGRETAELSSNELNERVYTEVGPITFTAIWKVTLKYHADRGQILNVLGSSDTVEIEYNKEVTLLLPTAADCSWKFTGWCYSSDMADPDNAPINNTFQTKSEDFVKYVDEHYNAQLQVDLYARWVMDIVTLDYGAADKENADLPRSVRNVVYGGAPIEDIPDAEEIKFPANNWYNRGSGWFADDAFTGESINFRNTDNYPRRMDTLYYQWIGKNLRVSLMYIDKGDVTTTYKQFDILVGGIVTESMGRPTGTSDIVESFLGYYWFKTAPKSFQDTTQESSLLQDAVLCFDGGGYQHTDWEFVPEGQQNVELYAVWGVSYTVTLDWGGGSDSGTTLKQVHVAKYGKLPSYTAKQAPVRTGYTFAGYFEDDDWTDAWYYADMSARDAIWKKGDATLHPKWDVNPLTVTANADTAYDLGEKTITFTVTGGTGSYSYSNSSGDGVSCSWSGNKLTIKKTGGSKNGTITVTVTDDNSGGKGTYKISYSTSSCLAPGTLITLADGSQVPVETLKGDEMLLVWNLLTGRQEAAPILFVDFDAEALYEIINLRFSDGTTVKVISEHAFWDFDLDQYVFLRADAEKYIGHWFNKHSDNAQGYEKVQLVGVERTEEWTTAWSPVTFGFLCYYVNGMLSMPGGVEGLINIFDVTPGTMQYDAEKMQREIEVYGLFTYEDFEDLIPEPIYEAFGGAYLKVAMGKGQITWDDIYALVARYAPFWSPL